MKILLFCIIFYDVSKMQIDIVTVGNCSKNDLCKLFSHVSP